MGYEENKDTNLDLGFAHGRSYMGATAFFANPRKKSKSGNTLNFFNFNF